MRSSVAACGRGARSIDRSVSRRSGAGGFSRRGGQLRQVGEQFLLVGQAGQEVADHLVRPLGGLAPGVQRDQQARERIEARTLPDNRVNSRGPCRTWVTSACRSMRAARCRT